MLLRSSKNYIDNYDNNIILFKNKKKQITTEKEALLFTEKYPYKNEMEFEEFDESCFNSFKELINETNDTISIGALIDAAYECCCYKLKKEDMVKLGTKGELIQEALEKYERLENRFKDILNKHYKYRNLLTSLLYENQDKFTIAEKIFLITEKNKYVFNKNNYFVDPDIYNLSDEYDQSLSFALDSKTNNLYSIYNI